MADVQKQTTTIAGAKVEYRLAPKMVVFSPGFGVHMQSPYMKLFRDIIDVLPPAIGYVLFSYYQEDDGKVEIPPTSANAALFINIVEWVHKQKDVTDVAAVAHSRGCIDTAVADVYPFSSVIMLAPPLDSASSRQRYTSKPGVEKQGDIWYVPRSDGATNLIPERALDEYEALNLTQILLTYANKQLLHVIASGADEVHAMQDNSLLQASPNITFETIRGADHNFQGAARSIVVQMVTDHLLQDLLHA